MNPNASERILSPLRINDFDSSVHDSSRDVISIRQIHSSQFSDLPFKD